VGVVQAETFNFTIFTLFIALISFGGNLEQNAFAQEIIGFCNI